FVGDTEPRPAAYSNVREEQSTGITHKLPAKVELCRKSSILASIYDTHVPYFSILVTFL
ncbi:MAG: palindromic element RPE1 domain-containing protein, partial [Candidatus Tisiphia sp.]